jgi:pyruvate dehydrogenase E2 component (dihydrolipoamide acetyltransferase)
MSIDVRVPTTGNAGEDAVVLDWNVAVGAEVSVGDVLVTLETAKAVLEVEAPTSGVVLKILFQEGDEAPEHDVLAILGEPGESLSEGAPAVSGPASDEDDPGTAAPALPSPSVVVAESQGLDQSATATEPSTNDGRISASPRARIIAERNGVSLAGLIGSGPAGRIIIADVLRAKSSSSASTPTPPAAPPAVSPAPMPVGVPAFTVVPVRGARKVTAQRMQASLRETAQLTLTRYATADTLLQYASRLKAVTEARGLPKIGVNDLLLFATARAVAKHPAANSWFDWDGIKQFTAVNLGFAVDTGAALLVPVISGADSLTLAGLSAAASDVIQKSREGKLSTQEMDGGTFTVSNLGGLGVHWFTPVLNPPQSCILGIGATHRSHPDGPSQLPLSLTFDHRALDGAAAAVLLADIAAAIETVDVLAAF